jgi:competence protein ComEA
MKKIIYLAIFLYTANVIGRPVNVNTADAQTLSDSLNGIGLVKAQAIVNYRNKNGEFKSMSDLAKVSGIGEKTLEKNKADILFSEETHKTTDNTVAPMTKINAK